MLGKYCVVLTVVYAPFAVLVNGNTNDGENEKSEDRRHNAHPDPTDLQTEQHSAHARWQKKTVSIERMGFLHDYTVVIDYDYLNS
jgi:hypothetical protein